MKETVPTMKIPREELLNVLRALESIVVSLDRIGSSTSAMSQEDRGKILAAYAEKWEIFSALAHVRRTLSALFSDDVGSDGMGELEREMQDIPHWSSDKPEPPWSDGIHGRVQRPSDR